MAARIRRLIFGAPKDVKDPHAFHKLSLVALLAWVGLGADGLSSSAYGPDEAFRQLPATTAEPIDVPFVVKEKEVAHVSSDR